MTAPDFTDEDLRDAERHLEQSIIASYGEPTKRAPASNNASKCGHPCAYYLWALRARNEDIPTPDDGMPGLWTLGREAENSAKIALLKEQWNLHRTEVTFRDEDLDITGRLDWELSRDDHQVWAKPIPTEFKGCSPNYMPKIRSFEDCFNSTMRWVRLWPMQALVYAYLMPEERPLVCLLLRNKVSARPKAIIERADRHFDRLVAMGEVLAEVNAALASGSKDGPSCISYDPVWCKGCDAEHICPTMQRHAYAGNMKLLEDSELIDHHAKTWDECSASKKAGETSWEAIKEICRHYGLYDGEVGDERIVFGDGWRYTVKIAKGGSGRLKVERIDIDSDPVVEG